jgi:hypothetical protein
VMIIVVFVRIYFMSPPAAAAAIHQRHKNK